MLLKKQLLMFCNQANKSIMPVNTVMHKKKKKYKKIHLLSDPEHTLSLCQKVGSFTCLQAWNTLREILSEWISSSSFRKRFQQFYISKQEKNEILIPTILSSPEHLHVILSINDRTWEVLFGIVVWFVWTPVVLWKTKSSTGLI